MTTLALTMGGKPQVDAAPRLLNRNFLVLWQAQLVSQFGNQAFAIALTFWTAEATRSATITGLVLMAGILPGVLLGPLTGAFADSGASRLRIVVACDLVRGALVAALALGFVAGSSTWLPTLLFAVALLVGICNAFFDPAVSALVPDLVPGDQLEGANAFAQSSRQITVLASQGLGGILYVIVGPAMLFLIDAVSFLCAGASELLIRMPTTSAGSPRPADAGRQRVSGCFGHASEGLRYVAAFPGLVGFLVTAALFNALLMPMSILLPVFATRYLHADVRWYGFLLAAISAGSIAGCMLVGAARLTGRSRQVLLIASFAALASALVVLGQLQSRWIALAIAAVTGALSGIVNVLVMSILQRRTSGEYRGRVIALHTTLTRALVPVGLVAGGAVADLTGRNVPLVYAVCGGLALASTMLLAGVHKTRAFLAST